MMNKKASDRLNILCIEKEAGAMNFAKGVADDVGIVTGLKKFKAPHDLSMSALKGAAGGGAVGAAIGAGSSNGKDTGGSTVKGGIMGALGGAALGAGGAKVLNDTAEKAFKQRQNSARLGAALGVASGVAAAKGTEKAMQFAKENPSIHDLGSKIKENAQNVVDHGGTTVKNVKGKFTSAVDKTKEKVSNVFNGAKEKVDKTIKNMQNPEIDKK